jgi:uncharacterized protein YjbI with pentapeptide repeats
LVICLPGTTITGSIPRMLDRLRFWVRALSRGAASLNTLAGWLSLVVLLLGVAAGIAVPLVFHVSHWVTAVAVMAAVFVGALEGSYLEWKDADIARRAAESALKAAHTELEAARRAASDADASLALRRLELTEQSQVTERFTRAVEQLGSGQPAVRLGGIHALERIMIDSARDHPTVVEQLAAFVREHAGGWPPEEWEDPDPELGPVAADVLAAVNALARRPRDREERAPVNLSGVILTYANFAGADLSGMDLSWANLEGTTLTRANLMGAKLQYAKIDRADLIDCTMVRANLYRSTLYGAQLGGADLSDANLNESKLAQAHLAAAKMHGARLTNADLTSTTLSGADFTGADLTGAIASGTDLSGTNLTDEQKSSLSSM